MTVSVTEAPERSRYEVRVDGELAGHLLYRQTDDVRTFVHTEVDDRFQGQGVAAQLVEGAVADLRTRGLRLIATCPYVVAWLRKHPEAAFPDDVIVTGS